jgi:hypothetical protein
MLEDDQLSRIAQLREGMQAVGTHPEARLWIELPTLTPSPTSLRSVQTIASRLSRTAPDNADPVA